MDLNIEIHKRTCKERFLVTGLGRQNIILGFPWLTKTNPIIDWQKGNLKWREPKTGKALPNQEKLLRTTTTITEERSEEHTSELQSL